MSKSITLKRHISEVNPDELMHPADLEWAEQFRSRIEAWLAESYPRQNAASLYDQYKVRRSWWLAMLVGASTVD